MQLQVLDTIRKTQQEHKTDEKMVWDLWRYLIRGRVGKKSQFPFSIDIWQEYPSECWDKSLSCHNGLLQKLKWDLKVKSYGKRDCPTGWGRCPLLCLSCTRQHSGEEPWWFYSFFLHELHCCSTTSLFCHSDNEIWASLKLKVHPFKAMKIVLWLSYSVKWVALHWWIKLLRGFMTCRCIRKMWIKNELHSKNMNEYENQAIFHENDFPGLNSLTNISSLLHRYYLRIIMKLWHKLSIIHSIIFN